VEHPEARRNPHASNLDRLIAGVRATAADLQAEFPEGVDVRPILAARLERIAEQMEALTSRDLLRMSPLAIAKSEVA